MALTYELLEGAIIDEYRSTMASEPAAEEKPATTIDAGCSENCESGSSTGDCCTSDKKKQQKEKQPRAAAWFDPPTAHR
jgi:hypothetical protein